jgi:hypothetical protein
VVPFVGAWISLLDPELREQPPLVSHGFSEALNRYGRSPAAVAEIEQLGLQRVRGAFRHGDLNISLAEVPSWAEYLAPAGFRGGLSAALFTQDGRYLGMLALTTDTAAHPTRAAQHLIGSLAATIASAVDPMRQISAAALVIRDAQAAVVLTRAGDTCPVPGLPGHPLLTRGSPVLKVAAAVLAARGDHAAFLSPDATADAQGQVRVTVLRSAQCPPYYLTGAVVVSAPADTLGLDRTELEILGLLLEDWSVERIASGLAVDEPAIHAAISTIQDKLAAPDLAVASMRALRRGAYIPAALTRAGE